MTIYQGDDLINLITVSISAEEGSTLPEIEYVEFKIGDIVKKYKKPTNPFNVSLTRKESQQLSVTNKCFAAIWYYGEIEGKRTLLKKTCEGSLTIKTKPEVIGDGCCC